MKTIISKQFLFVIIVICIFTQTLNLNVQQHELRPLKTQKVQTLHKNEQKPQNLKNSVTVTSSQVQNKALQTKLLGGFSQIPILQLTQSQLKIKQFVQKQKPQLQKSKLAKFQQQIVAGKNYRLTYSNQNEQNNQITQYKIIVYSKPWENIQQISEFQTTKTKKTGNSVSQTSVSSSSGPNLQSWAYKSIQLLFGQADKQEKEQKK